MAGLTPRGTADAGAFLTRLVRLNPDSLVRTRPAGTTGIELWARLPWAVLVTRQVSGTGWSDRTVLAGELLAALDEDRPLTNRDSLWRWPLPTSAGTVLETIPAAEIQRVGAAAARTLQIAGESGVAGQAVGERALRDALLDHVPIVVEDGDRRVDVSQRLVQAVLRMGFLGAGPDGGAPPVAVRFAGGWTGLAAGFGTAWRREDSPFTVHVAR